MLGAGAGQLDRRRLETLDGAEDDLAVLHVDDDGLAHAEFLPQDALRQRVLDELLDGPAQRPGPERGVVALVGQHDLGRRGELEAQALGLELVAHTPGS